MSKQDERRTRDALERTASELHRATQNTRNPLTREQAHERVRRAHIRHNERNR